MTGIIIVGLIVAFTAFAIIKFRVPAALVFFSLLVGQLLVSQVAEDVYLFVNTAAQNVGIEWIKLLLLLLPVILTLLFLKESVSKSKIFVEFVPAILTGMVVVLLIYPLIPALQNALNGNSTWQVIDTYKSLITFVASIACLVTSWMSFSKSRH